jgi:CheY-like chemotaxis protein
LALKAEQKGIELVWNVGRNIPEVVRGDSTRLRQVFINLIGNALKFTDVGQVAVYGRLAGTTTDGVILEFTVHDTGIGIAEEKRARIFEAFAQADMSTSRRYGGTGLGLSICDRLVKLMGGRIWVESEEGRGSEFHFTVKMFTDSAQEKPNPPHDVVQPNSQQIARRVLVVMANPVNRDLLQRLLERKNMTAVTTARAKDALTLLTQALSTAEKFSAMVIDKDIDDLGGLALLADVRHSAAADLPTILVHSHALDIAERKRCERLGVARTILKPFRRAALFEALRECLGEAIEIAVPTASKPKDAVERPSLRILLAEDNVVNQRLTSKLLERMGHVVTIAGNGQLALQRFFEQNFDLIAMDMQMPVMDGLEATEKIRASEKKSGRRVAIVAMTANAYEEDRERCLRAGMDGYIAKPISAKTIEMEIARVMAAQGKSEKLEVPGLG